MGLRKKFAAVLGVLVLASLSLSSCSSFGNAKSDWIWIQIGNSYIQVPPNSYCMERDESIDVGFSAPFPCSSGLQYKDGGVVVVFADEEKAQEYRDVLYGTFSDFPSNHAEVVFLYRTATVADFVFWPETMTLLQDGEKLSDTDFVEGMLKDWKEHEDVSRLSDGYIESWSVGKDTACFHQFAERGLFDDCGRDDVCQGYITTCVQNENDARFVTYYMDEEKKDTVNQIIETWTDEKPAGFGK